MPEVPEDLAQRIPSEVAAWIAELDILRRDPKIRYFLRLQAKVNQTDAIPGEPSQPPLPMRFTPFSSFDAIEFARDLLERSRGHKLGIPSNELSALKREDLEDVVLVRSQVPKRG